VDKEKDLPARAGAAKDAAVKETQPDYARRYTYADYLTWDDDKRWELIDGVPYLMSAPTRRHQKIGGNLFSLLWNFLRGKPCEVYYSPFDVRLNADTLDDTVVQPDIVVICDEANLDDAGCKGVPDLVIEILSPPTSRYDRITKFNKYLEVGVREYWIIDPEAKLLAVHILNGGGYIITPYSEEDTAPVRVLEGCEINLAEVFE